jgi:hypothetical protein
MGASKVGRPYCLARREDDLLVAICSAFDLLYWPGRALYDGHALRHRVSLYSSEFQHRVAVFDAARFPINDLAFHPSEPRLAVATGSYDGGYMFEGELLLWNRETGECRNAYNLTADGVPTIGTALAMHDRSVLVGTVDGRLLLYALVTG